MFVGMSLTIELKYTYFSSLMTILDFDDRNRAYVSEQEFLDYLSRTAYHNDYTKVVQIECHVGKNDWRQCECLAYYNSGGSMLALYNREYNYGEIL